MVIQQRSEDTEQQVVISWAAMHEERYPELKLLHHIPNGGSRNKREGAKLKRMGVLAGVSDLHLPVPKGRYHSLYIEMKYDEGTVSSNQKTFISRAAGYENYCCVCYSAEEAIAVLQRYLNLKDPDECMPYDNASILKGGRVKPLMKRGSDQR